VYPLVSPVKRGANESGHGGSARGDSELGRQRGLNGGSGVRDLEAARDSGARGRACGRGMASGAVALIEVKVGTGAGSVGSYAECGAGCEKERATP
jgi:hypothetical protein